MAHIIEDRIAETATTTGTGDFTVAGAIIGFLAFSAVMAVSDTCYYMIEAVDGSGIPTGEWETGLGTYSAANTITRTVVDRSSNANAAVAFSAGTKRVVLAVTRRNAGRGTAFPTSPYTGEIFRRTDRNIEYSYDGTRWLSTQLHSIVVPVSDATMPTTVTTAYKQRVGNPFTADHDLWVEKVKTQAYQTAATTASNYYSIAVIKARTAADGGDTTLATHSTQSLAQNDWINQSTTIGALAGINTAGFAVSLTKTGTQTIYVNAEVTFRLVG